MNSMRNINNIHSEKELSLSTIKPPPSAPPIHAHAHVHMHLLSYNHLPMFSYPWSLHCNERMDRDIITLLLSARPQRLQAFERLELNVCLQRDPLVYHTFRKKGGVLASCFLSLFFPPHPSKANQFFFTFGLVLLIFSPACLTRNDTCDLGAFHSQSWWL